MYVCIYAVSITKVMQNICCITRKVFNEFIFLLPFKKHTQRQRFSRFPQVNLRRKQNVRQAKGRAEHKHATECAAAGAAENLQQKLNPGAGQ